MGLRVILAGGILAIALWASCPVAADDGDENMGDVIAAQQGLIESISSIYAPRRESLEFQLQKQREMLDTESALADLVAGSGYIPPIPPDWREYKSRVGRSILVVRAMGYQRMMEERVQKLSTNELRNQIASGSALKLFLDTAGRAAVEHDELLRKLGEVDPQTLPTDKQRLLTLLFEMEDQTLLPPNSLQHVRFESGLRAESMTVEFRQSEDGQWILYPFAFSDWPVQLASEDRFTKDRDDFAKKWAGLVDTLMKPDMTSTDLIRPRDDLKYVIEQLAKKHKQFWADYKRSPGRGKRWSTSQWVNAFNHIERMQESVERLIDLDVLDLPELNPRRPELGLTIIELMSFMQTNNLRYAAATKEAEKNQLMLFRKTHAYWGALASFHLAIQSRERDMAAVQRELNIINQQEQMQVNMAMTLPVMKELAEDIFEPTPVILP